MKRIIVIDYGLGNLRSATRGLERAGAHVLVTPDPAEYDRADGLVLPGVGAFKSGMQNMQDKKKAFYDAVNEGTPVLGICLGMQMLLTTSEEGQQESGPVDGLDLINGHVKRFNFGENSERLKVPHMGWNRIGIIQDNALVRNVNSAYVYFVHSYYVEPGDHTIATAEYGVPFAAVVASGNVFGTQFHPEKSSAAGLRILQNFMEIC
ncbi:MAG: imidazole glycerol phosphate synthase subunit HisH [Halobacteriota archaeon]